MNNSEMLNKTCLVYAPRTQGKRKVSLQVFHRSITPCSFSCTVNMLFKCLQMFLQLIKTTSLKVTTKCSIWYIYWYIYSIWPLSYIPSIYTQNNFLCSYSQVFMCVCVCMVSSQIKRIKTCNYNDIGSYRRFLIWEVIEIKCKGAKSIGEGFQI